jgi:hypothetical protein
MVFLVETCAHQSLGRSHRLHEMARSVHEWSRKEHQRVKDAQKQNPKAEFDESDIELNMIPIPQVSSARNKGLHITH